MIEDIVTKYELNERTEDSKTLEEYIILGEEDSGWAPNWLKTNFCNVDKNFSNLSDAVGKIFIENGAIDTIINTK